MTEITRQQRDEAIINLYKTGNFMTEYIAKTYGLTPRSVQRLAKKSGVIRTLKEANKVIAPLKNYRTIPKEFRVQGKSLTLKVRFKILSNHPFCSLCGMTPTEGVRLEVDHIDEDPTNNEESNLEVLCNRCNVGKSHLSRF